MNILYCDVCKKAVEQPLPGRTFFHIGEVEICETCSDDLRLIMKPLVRAKKPFDFGWADDYMMKVLKEGVAKGKLQLPRR